MNKYLKKFPDPVSLLFFLTISLFVMSYFLSDIHFAQEALRVKNLFEMNFLKQYLVNFPQHFLNYRPLGIVVAIMVGMGVLEKSGFIEAILKYFLTFLPSKAIVPTILFVAIMSSLAADVGHVIIPPIAARIFLKKYNAPLLGLCLGFAGVSGGLSANLLITGLDPILAEIATQAMENIGISYVVKSTGNWYFLCASVFLVMMALMIAHHFFVKKIYLRSFQQEENSCAVKKEKALLPLEKRALKETFFLFILLFGLNAYLIWGPLHFFQRGENVFQGLEESLTGLLFIYSFSLGTYFSFRSKKVSSFGEIVGMVYQSLRNLGPYFALIFFLTQFLYLFKESNLILVGNVFLLKTFTLLGVYWPSFLLLTIITSSLFNIFIGSAITKWALLAPFFIPLGLEMNLTPEVVMLAYRIGDSASNNISPMMPYFLLILGFAQEYRPSLKTGDFLKLLFPYSIILLLSWIIFLFTWIYLDFPLGPQAGVFYK